MNALTQLQDALLHHVRRAVYQAGIWTTADQPIQHLPSPDQFGWTDEQGVWSPKWIALPQVAAACRELWWPTTVMAK